MERQFEPVATRRTFEEALQQIADKLRAGDLHAGDRLPSERDLAAQMQISRPTVREAVKALVDAGVLEVRRGQTGGIFVRSELVPRDLVRIGWEVRVGEVAGVLEARRLLEPRVAQLAAVHASGDDFAAMQKTIDRQAELAGKPDFLRHEDLFLQLDLAFHLAIARSTGNSTVVSLMRSLFRRLELARDMAMHAPTIPEWTIDIHERTLDAIRSADFDLIDKVMDEHLAQLEQVWEDETGRGMVRPLPGLPSARRGAVADAARRRLSLTSARRYFVVALGHGRCRCRAAAACRGRAPAGRSVRPGAAAAEPALRGVGRLCPSAVPLPCGFVGAGAGVGFGVPAGVAFVGRGVRPGGLGPPDCGTPLVGGVPLGRVFVPAVRPARRRRLRRGSRPASENRASAVAEPPDPSRRRPSLVGGRVRRLRVALRRRRWLALAGRRKARAGRRAARSRAPAGGAGASACSVAGARAEHGPNRVAHLWDAGDGAAAADDERGEQRDEPAVARAHDDRLAGLARLLP